MLLTIIVFFLVLSLLVFAHELGHFFVARKFGVKAEEFGFGFPPRIFGLQILKRARLIGTSQTEEITAEVIDQPLADGSEVIQEKITDKIKEIDLVAPTKKWHFIRGGRDLTPEEKDFGTVYSINWLPLGGFVKIKGENGEHEEDKDSFAAQPIWQRSAILSAGVSLNIILAMILITIGFMIGLPQALDNLGHNAEVSHRQVQIVQIFDASPAAGAGLAVGDAIVGINDQSFINYDELQKYVADRAGEKLNYRIKRGQEEFVSQITPEIRPESGKGGIGIGIAETGIVKYPWYIAIWQGIKTTFVLLWVIIVAFYQLFKGLIIGQGLSVELAGPVGIAALTGEVTRMGFIYLLQFTALLSINLATINFLPFPALDGGRVLFLIIEKFKGSPVKRELENIIHNIGFALLMLLVLVVTFRDISRFSGVFKGIWEKIF